MKLTVKSALFIKEIKDERNRAIKCANSTHPNTQGWTLELIDSGLLITTPSGKLKLVPMSNVAEMEVEKVVTPVKVVKTVKKGK